MSETANDEQRCIKCQSYQVEPHTTGIKCISCGFIEPWQKHYDRLGSKIKKEYRVSKQSVQNTPKMTDREKFVSVFTALILNPVVQGLSLKRRDEILMQMKNKFCPSLTNAEWYVLFHGCENLRSQLTNYLQAITTVEEQSNIQSNFIKLVGDGNYGDIAELSKKVQDKMRKN